MAPILVPTSPAEGSPVPVPVVSIPTNVVFPGAASDETYVEILEWSTPITYFVGRNGSGKSRTARAVARQLSGRLLATDRLVGLMSFVGYTWGSQITAFKGVPLDDTDRKRVDQASHEGGLAGSDLYALKEQPEVALRVAAFLRRALHREVEIRESAGYLDPYIQLGGTSYSLLRDEGHGLREIVVLLIATYRADTRILIVDEPELHLHPAMARLWLGELRRECEATGKRAVLVTHNPGMIRPQSMKDLTGIYHFSPDRRPTRLSDCIKDEQETAVVAALDQFPTLVSDLVFSPRPVLVEGPSDAAALNTTLRRMASHEVVEQTDLIPCGGSNGVATWFEIAKNLGVDVRAVVDLDALLTGSLQRVLNDDPVSSQLLADRLLAPAVRASEVLAPLLKQARDAGVPSNPKDRARWLSQDANLPQELDRKRRDLLIEVSKGQGMWLHPQGTLEHVLDVQGSKSVEKAAAAARTSGAIDEVARWVGYQLDASGEVKNLLQESVARVCQAIQLFLLREPTQSFTAPVGPSAQADARLVDVSPAEQAGYHRVSVKAPEEFVGWFVEFDVHTPPTGLNTLTPPPAPAAVATG